MRTAGNQLGDFRVIVDVRETEAHVAVGHDVQLRTAGDIAGKNRFRGTVVAATERSARIAVGEKELDIPYETIVRGNLIDEG